jgi:hypothetical protein
MERNLNSGEGSRIMETGKFNLEFVPRRFSEKPYEGGKFGRWPIGVRIKLNGVYLGDKTQDGKTQPAGDYFGESTFIDTGRYVLDGIRTNFPVGHSARVCLQFVYPSNERVEISLDNGVGRNISFDPKVIRPAVLDRESAAFEFFRGQNDLFRDVLDCKDEPTLDMLASSQIEMHNDLRISGLFRQYGVELAQVPERCLEAQQGISN